MNYIYIAINLIIITYVELYVVMNIQISKIVEIRINFACSAHRCVPHTGVFRTPVGYVSSSDLIQSDRI